MIQGEKNSCLKWFFWTMVTLGLYPFVWAKVHLDKMQVYSPVSRSVFLRSMLNYCWAKWYQLEFLLPLLFILCVPLFLIGLFVKLFFNNLSFSWLSSLVDFFGKVFQGIQIALLFFFVVLWISYVVDSLRIGLEWNRLCVKHPLKQEALISPDMRKVLWCMALFCLPFLLILILILFSQIYGSHSL